MIDEGEPLAAADPLNDDRTVSRLDASVAEAFTAAGALAAEVCASW